MLLVGQLKIIKYQHIKDKHLLKFFIYLFLDLILIDFNFRIPSNLLYFFFRDLKPENILLDDRGTSVYMIYLNFLQ